MGKLTKTTIIENYLSEHPQATHKQIYAAVNSDGKEEITLPYCSKIACAWRKKQKQLPHRKSKSPSNNTFFSSNIPPSIIPEGVELGEELLQIFHIMRVAKSLGLKTTFREIHDYIRDEGNTTQAEVEQKLTAKKLTIKELVHLVLEE